VKRPSVWTGFLAWAVRVVFRLLYRVEVRGELRLSDRTLIVANHQSFLDGILLGAFLPFWPTYLVHTSIAAKWYFRLPLRLIPHAVADTTKPMAVKTLAGLVESGRPVMIFPEGRVTVTGGLMKVYDGPAFVAAKTGCAVVPVHIDGTVYTPFTRMSGRGPTRWFPRVAITILPPVTISMPEAPKARDRRRAASEILRRIMQESAYASRRKSTLFESLVESAGLHGRRKKILEDINSNFEPASYARIVRGSLALGRLVSKITAEGETVGLLMPNANPTVALLFGVTAARRVAAMLNYTSGVHGLEHACRIAAIRTVLTSRAFVEKAELGDTVSRLTGVRVVYLEDLRQELGLGDKLWIAGASLRPKRAFVPPRPGDPAVVMFTSGSEGVPKGVVLSHDAVLANIAQINASFPFSSGERFLSALPLFHAFGITAGILVPLLRGFPVVLYPTPLHYRTVPEFTYDHDCTVLFTTNTFLAKYAKAAHPYDLHNVRFLVVGAEKLGDEVKRLCMEKFGLRVLEGYGATECAPVIAANTPLAYRAGTVGEILPGMEYRVVPVPGFDGGGVLHIRGENVMMGYLDETKPGSVRPVESECGPGWYSTGDVVTVDERFVTIHARLKRFAKIAGEMVSLELAERIAADASPGAVHAAVAYRDSARGEVIILFTQDPKLDRPALLDAARRLGAPELSVPRRVVHLSKIPAQAGGKKDYMALSQMAEQQAQPPQVTV
jgi:acyl-[acyl-carrier-protein]-phospholipid O-acyltransferase / long-chain-fatty-acid--[acyl-carrier-protein] ligase